ncbi:MAG: porin, partial [Alphaproteobacteria bacterium]|nr:porin [Alphaproteobacteria bacterium]
MKKQLLATTALVAGGLIAGVAQAAEPIKLSLGGYVTTGLTVREQDNVATAAGVD